MTVLHVGCLPFPTHQGTQGAIAAMMEASTELSIDAHLLTYAGRAHETAMRYPIHRLGNWPRVESLRSGPSLGKLALDVRMVRRIRTVCREIGPRAIVAHHIEAALAAIAASVRPVYYVAHTALALELPVYFPAIAERPTSTAGRVLERVVRRRAGGVAAIAPLLARTLGPDFHYLPVPWPHDKGAEPRSPARRNLGVPEYAPVALYAGNLDRYQGWEDLIAALEVLREAHPNARLLVATESAPTPLIERARTAGLVDALRLTRLDSDAMRARVHGAADFAWVPRRTPGGLPIKMLDAFARGLPVVAPRRATAGLSVDHACIVVPDDDPSALAAGAHRLLSAENLAGEYARAARRYLASEHGPEAFGVAMQALTRSVGAKPGRPPSRDAAVRRAP
ncbi:MAG: glycosyltransferase [Myxococcota bacterium]